jgi:predicted HicB family RNase H-like nuclease
MTKKMPLTPEQEHDYSAETDNQRAQGPPRRRQSRLSERVPVRFTPELLDKIRRRAEADDRSLSSWIRRAAEHQLSNSS